jgi:hypothetical protein
MNRLTQYLSPTTERDLQNLMEPVSDYISAVGTMAQQKVAVIAAIIILIEGVQQVNTTALAYLDTRSEDHIG